MSVLFDSVIIVVLFFIFAYSHSLLATFNIKEKIAHQIGDKIAFYRLFYNFTAILIFIAIYYISPKPDIIIFDLQFPYDLIIFSIQLIGIFGFIWAGSYIKIGEFLGISQIKRFLTGNYKVSELDEKHGFIEKGPFKYSRHPIYFFSIIILGFRPTFDLFYFIFFLCMLSYFYAGSIYEEKNLEKYFGTTYINYKMNVPRFIPNFFNKSK